MIFSSASSHLTLTLALALALALALTLALTLALNLTPTLTFMPLNMTAAWPALLSSAISHGAI